jgi:hypothetical protein
MSTDHEQTPRKLVYLRDHAPRPRARTVRPDRSKQPPATHPELASEATWLGRLLTMVSGLLALHCLLVASGAVKPEAALAANWSASGLLANLYVIVTTGMASRQLLHGALRAPALVALAASGMIVVAVEGLAHLVVNTDLSRISLGARMDILARTAMLAIGVWGASFALRAERRAPTPP